MKKLRELRLKRKLSLRDLEKLSGVDHSTIGRIENGDFLPGLGNLWKLAKALEVPIEELIDEDELVEMVG